MGQQQKRHEELKGGCETPASEHGDGLLSDFMSRSRTVASAACAEAASCDSATPASPEPQQQQQQLDADDVETPPQRASKRKRRDGERNPEAKPPKEQGGRRNPEEFVA